MDLDPDMLPDHDDADASLADEVAGRALEVSRTPPASATGVPVRRVGRRRCPRRRQRRAL